MSTKYIVNNVSGQTITGDLTINGNVVITGTTNTRPYKVFTALLTQTGTDNEPEVTSGDLTIGVTYRINVDGTDADFTNVGAPNNNLETYFLATGTTPNSWGTNGSLRFNSGAPTVTVLENTIGNVWFTYDSVGTYQCQSDNLFTEDKTTISLDAHGQDGNPAVLLSNQTLFPVNKFYIYTDKLGAQDDMLNKNRIEIRVYN